jgi:hypothetical protein
MLPKAKGNCRSQKKSTIAGRNMTRCAGVAWRKRNAVRKYRTRNQVERGTLKGREKTVEGPKMQNWNDEPGNKTVAACENQEDTIWVRQSRGHNMASTGRLSD